MTEYKSVKVTAGPRRLGRSPDHHADRGQAANLLGHRRRHPPGRPADRRPHRRQPVRRLQELGSLRQDRRRGHRLRWHRPRRGLPDEEGAHRRHPRHLPGRPPGAVHHRGAVRLGRQAGRRGRRHDRRRRSRVSSTRRRSPQVGGRSRPSSAMACSSSSATTPRRAARHLGAPPAHVADDGPQPGDPCASEASTSRSSRSGTSSRTTCSTSATSTSRPTAAPRPSCPVTSASVPATCLCCTSATRSRITRPGDSTGSQEDT